MNLILPNYLLVRRNFVCKRCSFKFFKVGPSRVEKCPKCSSVVYDTDYKGEALDPYSASKLRWYTNEGQHIEEIKNRKIKTVNGKKVVANTDGKGHVIDYIPTFDVSGTATGTKQGKGELK